MKATFAPLATKKEPVTQNYSRESIYDSKLQEKYDYFKKKGLPVKIPHRPETKIAYSQAIELPFVEFQPSNRFMSKFLIDDDSGDKKSAREDTEYRIKKIQYFNELYGAKLSLDTALMNQQYLEWKNYYSTEGPQIKWTGEVSFYGSYILFVIGLRLTPEFFENIFFKSGMYQSKGGRFLILQFFEQILNIRFVKDYYMLLERVGNIPLEQLAENVDYKSLMSKLKPGFTTLFPMIEGTLAIAQSFFREKNIPFSALFMKKMPALLASPTINYVAASIAVNLFGGSVPILVSQLASSVVVQFLSGKITQLTQVYFFADLAEEEEKQRQIEARKLIEQEHRQELEIRKKYVEIGIVGKDIDERIKMKFDWEGNFGKNIAKFQENLFKMWKTRGKALPFFGSAGFDALLFLWSSTTTMAFITFMTTNNFSDYQLASGKNIDIRFLLDFITQMLRSFRFFDGMFSIEALALPVVQKLRNDMIRIFTELASGILSDISSFSDKVLKKTFYTNGSFTFVDRLQKQSMFAYYFFEAMTKILETVSAIKDPAFRLILENYLNLSIPTSQTLVTNLFLISIEDSLDLFEKLNLFFMEFGVVPLQTAEGHISFYNYILRNASKGQYANPAPVLYKLKKDEPSFLKSGTFLREAFDFFSIQVPRSFSGYERDLLLLPLPTKNKSQKNNFLNIPLGELDKSIQNKLGNLWDSIGIYQKIPAIYNYFLEGVKEPEKLGQDKLRLIFDTKMKDQSLINILNLLQIPESARSIFTFESFNEFSMKQTSFIKNALLLVNDDFEKEYTLQDIYDGSLKDSAHMKSFCDYFAQEYSDFVNSIVLKNASMYKTFNKSITASFAFQKEDKIAYHNLILSRGETPAGYAKLTFDQLKNKMLNKDFFFPKLKVKKLGFMKEGKFVEDINGSLFEFEETFPLPEDEKQQIVSYFEMILGMGYNINYKEQEGEPPADFKQSDANELIKYFQDFVTQMVKSSIQLTGEEAWPTLWKVERLREGLYLSPSNVFFSGEMNVVRIGENTHFYYNWKKHAGLSSYIYPSRYDISSQENMLEKLFRKGELKGDYLDKFIQLVASRKLNQASRDMINNNRAVSKYNLRLEYEKLSLRNLSEIKMYNLLSGFLKEDGDTSFLSGENPEVLTMSKILAKIMSSIGPLGMFPNHLTAIYGSPGGDITNNVIGNLETAKKENTFWGVSSTSYLTLEEYWNKYKEKDIFFQRILAYIFHGWFSKAGAPATYQAKLKTITPNQPVKTNSNLKILGEEENINLFDPLQYRELINSTSNGVNLRDLKPDDDLLMFLNFLYLITDKDGKINVPAFKKHIERLNSNRDKSVQVDYIYSQISQLSEIGEKKDDFLKCFLKREECRSYSNKKEINIEQSSHLIFQINYLLDVLKVKDRITETPPRGIKTTEIYDSFYPYLVSMSGKTFPHIGTFYFKSNSYLGLDFSLIDDILTGTPFADEYDKLKKRIITKKQTLLLGLLGFEGYVEISQRQIERLTTAITEVPADSRSIKDFIIKKLKDLADETTGGSLWNTLFGSDDIANKKFEQFFSKLESSYILRKMIEDDDLERIRRLLSENMYVIQSEETIKIEELAARNFEIEQDYNRRIQVIKEQRASIEDKLQQLLDFYLENKPASDMGPLRPTTNIGVSSTTATGTAPSTTTTTVGPSLQTSTVEQARPQQATAIRESVTQELSTKLAQAEKVSNIQRMVNELRQSSTLAQREDLRLKLMTAFLEMFGGDESFMLGFGDLDLNRFLADIFGLPIAEGLAIPERHEIPSGDIDLFTRCAQVSHEYELLGALDIKPYTDDIGKVETYKDCRQEAYLVKLTKKTFSGLFDFAKIAAKIGASGTCATISAIVGGIVSGAKASAACGGPFNPVGFGCFVFGVASGALSSGAASVPLCNKAVNLVLQFLIPKYVNDKIVKPSPLLTSLKESNPEVFEKIQIYNSFFEKFPTAEGPAKTAKEIKELRLDLANLVTLLLVESNFSENDPGKPAEPFSQILFGSGKLTDFNYYPFFKPSLEQITFFRNLGVFDFSSVRNPNDLLEQIKNVKLKLDQNTLNVLFGQKYVMPGPDEIGFQRSFNIWNKIGESIRLLDEYDERENEKKRAQGKADEIKIQGNLYEILTDSKKLITEMFSSDNTDLDNIITDAKKEDEAKKEEERKAEEERRKRQIKEQMQNARVFPLEGFMRQAYNIIKNIQLDDVQVQSAAILEQPLLLEKNTVNGIYKSTNIQINGTSSDMDMYRIGTSYNIDNNNDDWKDLSKITDSEKKKIRNLFNSDHDFTYISYFASKYSLIPTHYNIQTKKIAGFFEQKTSIYDEIYKILDYIPKYNGITYNNFFFTYKEIEGGIQRAYLPEEVSYTIFGKKKMPDERYNMQTHGNFPPFFIISEQRWENKKSQFSSVLNKFYISQQTNISIEGSQDTIGARAFFLSKDINTFDKLQDEPKISLFDALLGKKFRVKGIPGEEFSILEEKGDTQITKWWKGILIKMIFSTINSSFSNLFDIIEEDDTATGDKVTNLMLYTTGNKKDSFIGATYKYEGSFNTLENVRLRELHEKQEAEKKLKQEKEQYGFQDFTDLDPKTIKSFDLLYKKLEPNQNVFKELNEKDKGLANEILRGILLLKLSKHFETIKDDKTKPEEARVIFNKDFPILQKIGSDELRSISTRVGFKFERIYSIILKNIVGVSKGLDIDKEMEDTLLAPITFTYSSGGENLLVEKWNTLFDPGEEMAFPIIQVSVYQKEVYYPNILVNKYFFKDT